MLPPVQVPRVLERGQRAKPARSGGDLLRSRLVHNIVLEVLQEAQDGREFPLGEGHSSLRGPSRYVLDLPLASLHAPYSE